MDYKKFILSFVSFVLIFFLFPTLIYSFFSKFYGMEPPFKIFSDDISYIVYLQIFQALIFLLVFWVIIRKNREKAIPIGILTSVLLFFLAEFSPKVAHAFIFQYISTFYLKISLLAGLLTYLVCGFFLGKVFKEKKETLRL
ncbi:MAG: hypothetical protein HYW47_06775 [Deltaproteobacteria bacterium]|nr:hypothetical protein [Deltaproteobacteria bacterium]